MDDKEILSAIAKSKEAQSSDEVEKIRSFLPENLIRIIFQSSSNHSQGIGFLECLICNMPFDDLDKVIKSHSISEPTLELIRDSSLKVAYISRHTALSTDFQTIRKRSPASAGVFKMVHHKCDSREFLKYESGDYSPEGCLSLIRKIIYSEKATAISNYIYSQLQVRFTSSIIEKFSDELISELNLGSATEAESEKVLQIRLKYARRPIIPKLKFFEETRKLNYDDFFFESRIIENAIPLAFQGIAGSFATTKGRKPAVFFAHLPQQSGKTRLFIATLKEDSGDYFNIAKKSPILYFLAAIGSQDQKIFWNDELVSSGMRKLIVNSGYGKVIPTNHLLDSSIDIEGLTKETTNEEKTLLLSSYSE